MKKKLFSLVTAVCLFASCLIFAGCMTTSGSQSQSQSSAQMTITITDIPAEYSGTVGMLTLGPPGTESGSNIAWAMNNIRSNNTFTGSMLDWDRDRPWYRSGNYYVMLMIDETMDALAERGREPMFTGIIQSKSINQENVSISFEEFIRY